MKQSHTTFREVEPEPAQPDAQLRPLRSMLLLQAMRKVMADADVIMARRQLQSCQQALEAMQLSLRECIDNTQRERSQAIGLLKQSPAEIRALVFWRQRTQEFLEKIEAHKLETQEATEQLQHSEEALKARLLLRRQIELRQCKYEEIFKSLS